MSIQDLILFCSTPSRACTPCIDFVYRHQLPVQVVRLDTPEARQRASQGKYFQIQVVPTLVVIRKGGELQLFAGQQKVGSWLSNLVSPPPQKSSSHAHATKTVITEPMSEDSDSEPEFIESEPKKGDISHGGLYSGKPKKKKKHRKSRKHHHRRKKEPVTMIPKEEGTPDSEGEEVEIEFVEGSPGRPPPPPTQGLMVGAQAPKKKSGSNIFDIAKQMEAQWKNSPWYRDNPPSY